MKTRINVAIRMRPLTEQEKENGNSSNIIHLDEQNNVVKYI